MKIQKKKLFNENTNFLQCPWCVRLCSIYYVLVTLLGGFDFWRFLEKRFDFFSLNDFSFEILNFENPCFISSWEFLKKNGENGYVFYAFIFCFWMLKGFKNPPRFLYNFLLANTIFLFILWRIRLIWFFFLLYEYPQNPKNTSSTVCARILTRTPASFTRIDKWLLRGQGKFEPILSSLKISFILLIMLYSF